MSELSGISFVGKAEATSAILTLSDSHCKNSSSFHIFPERTSKPDNSSASGLISHPKSGSIVKGNVKGSLPSELFELIKVIFPSDTTNLKGVSSGGEHSHCKPSLFVKNSFALTAGDRRL